MAEYIVLSNMTFKVMPDTRRKYLAIGIDYDGTYYIKCPDGYTDKRLRRELSSQIKDIMHRLANTEKKTSVHEYRQGEMFYFRGELYPLKHCCEEAILPLELRDGAFFLSPRLIGEEYGVFEQWYSRRLYFDIKDMLPIWTKRIGVSPRRVQIKTVKTLWGSCSAKSNITFSTRLALVPPSILEYVMVHELCHMREMNHSPEFWSEVSKHMPDYKDKRAQLKKNENLYVW